MATSPLESFDEPVLPPVSVEGGGPVEVGLVVGVLSGEVVEGLEDGEAGSGEGPGPGPETGPAGRGWWQRTGVPDERVGTYPEESCHHWAEWSQSEGRSFRSHQ